MPSTQSPKPEPDHPAVPALLGTAQAVAVRTKPTVPVVEASPPPAGASS